MQTLVFGVIGCFSPTLSLAQPTATRSTSNESLSDVQGVTQEKARNVKRATPKSRQRQAIVTQRRRGPPLHGFLTGAQAFSWQDTTTMTIGNRSFSLRSGIYGAALVARYDFRHRSFPVFVDTTLGYGQAHARDLSPEVRFNQSHVTLIDSSLSMTFQILRRRTISLGLGPFVQYRVIDLSFPTADTAYERGLFLYGGTLSLNWRWANSWWFNQSLSIAAANAEPIWRAGLMWTAL